MIQIDAKGVVNYHEIRDGHNWRTTIRPGDTERAEELLTPEELTEVHAAWTDDVIAAYQARIAAAEAAEPDPATERPSVEKRLEAIEDALLSGEDADRQRVRDIVERLRLRSA